MSLARFRETMLDTTALCCHQLSTRAPILYTCRTPIGPIGVRGLWWQDSRLQSQGISLLLPQDARFDCHIAAFFCALPTNANGNQQYVA